MISARSGMLISLPHKNEASEIPEPEPVIRKNDYDDDIVGSDVLSSEDIHTSDTDTAYEFENAWFCLTPQNPMRKALFWLLKWSWFRAFIILSILVNTAMMGAYDPLNPDSAANNALAISEWVFLVIFLVEAILKLIAMGAIMHSGSYFRDPWNWLDFIIVILSVIAVLPISGANLSGIRALRSLRALRLLRFITELNLQITTLFKAIPYLVNAVVLLFILYTIFAIVGLQVFVGRLRQHCVDIVTGTFDVNQCCSLSGDGQGFDCALLGPSFECRVTPLNPRFDQVSFDNFALALLTTYQTVSPENWSLIAVWVMDATSRAAIIFFVFLIVLGTFILVNLFVSVVTGVLSLEKEELSHRPPPRPKGRFLLWFIAKYHDIKNAERGRDNYRFLFAVHQLVESSVFLIVVYGAIFANLIVLCLTYYPQSQSMKDALDIVDIILNSVFTLEIVLKWIGLGFYLWSRVGFNWFDLIIVAASWVGLAIGGGTSVIRVLRSFRLFKLLALWPAFAKILRTASKAVSGAAWFMVLLFLYLYIFSIIGMQVFGGRFFFTDSYPRWNYDNLWTAFLSSFLVLSGESWPSVMQDGIRAIGWSATVFFIIETAIGVWVILNLFLAILLGAFDEDDEEDVQEDELKQEDQNSDIPLIPSNEGNNATMEDVPDSIPVATEASPFVHSEGVRTRSSSLDEPEQRNRSTSPNTRGRSSSLLESTMSPENRVRAASVLVAFKSTLVEGASKSVPLPEERAHDDPFGDVPIPQGKAFFFLTKDNPLRLGLFRLVSSSAFETFILLSILVGCLVLGLENPTWFQQFQWRLVFSAFEFLFMVIFFLEIVFKLIAYGCVGHEGAYLRDGWNILDFLVVLVSFLSILLGFIADVNIGFLRAFRAFRAFRLMGRFARTRLVVLVFLKSIPQVINVIIFDLVIWFIFAIIATELFQGTTALCNDLTVLNKTQCVGTFFQASAGLTIQRVWSNRPWGSFDNVGSSLYVLFPCIGISGWNDVMYATMDIVGVEQQPQRYSSPANGAFFVAFIIVGGWFNSNLFTGAILDTFNRIEKEEKEGGLFLTEEQRQWVQLQKQLINIKPRTLYAIPTNQWREYCYRLVINDSFTYFMAAIILINMAILCMDYYGSSSEYQLGLAIANTVFMAIFLFEFIVKLIALGPKQYFSDVWCILDAIIVVGSLVDVCMTFIPGLEGTFSASVIRVLRTLRLLKLVKWSKKLRVLLVSLLIAIPPVLNVLALWFIVLYIYAVIGVSVFGTAEYGQYLFPPATFENWGQAVFCLLRVLTGEAWESVMFDLYNQGYAGVGAYYFTFQVLSGMLLLQMIVGIMLNTFQDLFLVPEGSLGTNSMQTFAEAWSKNDPYNLGYIGPYLLPSLLAEVAPPLGPGKLSRSKMLDYIMRLDLPLRKDANGHDAVFYADLLRTLAHLAAPPNINDPDAIQKLEASWRKKYPQLAERGERAYTIAEYVAAIHIQRAYRMWRSGGTITKGNRAQVYQNVIRGKKLGDIARESEKPEKGSRGAGLDQQQRGVSVLRRTASPLSLGKSSKMSTSSGRTLGRKLAEKGNDGEEAEEEELEN